MTYEQDDVKRRRAERRRKIRRKRIITGFISFLIIGLVVLSVLCVTVFFNVGRISVSGSKIYTAQQVAAASEVTENSNLILLSEKKLTEKIRLKLPFVDSIKIKRDFPHHLIVTVNDASEYACIKSGDEYFTVSKKGFVLKSYAEKPENVFEIICSKPTLNMGIQAQLQKKSEISIIEEIVRNLNAKSIPINYVDVTNSLNISVKVCGRFSVNLGTNANLDKKIAHLDGMIKEINEEKTGKINLSMWTSKKTEGSFVEGDIK